MRDTVTTVSSADPASPDRTVVRRVAIAAFVGTSMEWCREWCRERSLVMATATRHAGLSTPDPTLTTHEDEWNLRVERAAVHRS